MNFLTNSEDICVGDSILRTLELSQADIVSLIESLHKVLYFVDKADVTYFETSANVAVCARRILEAIHIVTIESCIRLSLRIAR